MAGDPSQDEASGFAQLGFSGLGSALTDLLLCDEIIPGSPPSYAVCKTIYVYHPLGQKIAEGPINMAQSQEREISIPGAPESRLIPAFKREWQNLGVVGADQIAKQTMVLSRVYGISTLAIGTRGGKSDDPLPLDELYKADLYFNIFDPLNTAGSLVLNQNPNAPDFQKPQLVRAGTQNWHPSRVVVMMNEQPIFIDFTSSAFGFVGRSVYQRALFPLKTFVQSMVTDQTVTQKIALLIWKAKAPSSKMDNRIMQMFGWKRQQLKGGMTGNVLQIGESEDVTSLNFQNLEGAGRFTRENVLKNIATGAGGMPARILDMETLVEGFGEGSEDAKQIARFVDGVRIDMQPIYTKLDEVVQRRAWNPDFYKGIQKEFSEYRRVPYETAFCDWKNAFTAIWPNLLTEPDSEKAKVADAKFKTVVGLVETLAPILGPRNKAALAMWAADEANQQKELFSSPLILDEEEIVEAPALGGEEEEEPEPRPFSLAS
jgi:hypothetical protein